MQEGFVDLLQAIPELQVEIRYATAHNLTGRPLDGYEAEKAVGTVQMAQALQKAFAMAKKLGYGMRVYDAYRPQRAVDHFVRWSQTPEDGLTKQEFYPALEKADLFPQGYIARKSGHSRGSVVDLTLTKDGQPVEMGTAFDFMDERSHHPNTEVSQEAQYHRAVLRAIMAYAGFAPYHAEWWHYLLMEEPYPDTYFDFVIV